MAVAAWLQERHKHSSWSRVPARFPANERETRLYTVSLALAGEHRASAIRSHLAIENSLHWSMDMVFRDDECRVRTYHAPANFNAVKHMHAALANSSLHLKRKVAAWDDDFLAHLISA